MTKAIIETLKTAIKFKDVSIIQSLLYNDPIHGPERLKAIKSDITALNELMRKSLFNYFPQGLQFFLGLGADVNHKFNVNFSEYSLITMLEEYPQNNSRETSLTPLLFCCLSRNEANSQDNIEMLKILLGYSPEMNEGLPNKYKVLKSHQENLVYPIEAAFYAGNLTAIDLLIDSGSNLSGLPSSGEAYPATWHDSYGYYPSIPKQKTEYAVLSNQVYASNSMKRFAEQKAEYSKLINSLKTILDTNPEQLHNITYTPPSTNFVPNLHRLYDVLNEVLKLNLSKTFSNRGNPQSVTNSLVAVSSSSSSSSSSLESKDQESKSSEQSPNSFLHPEHQKAKALFIDSLVTSALRRVNDQIEQSDASHDNQTKLRLSILRDNLLLGIDQMCKVHSILMQAQIKSEGQPVAEPLIDIITGYIDPIEQDLVNASRNALKNKAQEKQTKELEAKDDEIQQLKARIAELEKANAKPISAPIVDSSTSRSSSAATTWVERVATNNTSANGLMTQR